MGTCNNNRRSKALLDWILTALRKKAAQEQQKVIKLKWEKAKIEKTIEAAKIEKESRDL